MVSKVALSILVLATAILQICYGLYPCICDTVHPQIEIMECPSMSSKPIGLLYSDVDYTLSHGLVHKDDTHCKPFARGVHSPNGWIPVVHARKIGYMIVDSGLKFDWCPGHDVQGPLAQVNCSPTPQSTTSQAVPTVSSTVATSTTMQHTTPKAPLVPDTAPSATTKVPSNTMPLVSKIIIVKPSILPASQRTPSTTNVLGNNTMSSVSKIMPAKATSLPASQRTPSTAKAPPTTNAMSSSASLPASQRTLSTAKVPLTTNVMSTSTTASTGTILTTGGMIVCNKIEIFKDYAKHEAIENALSRVCPNGNFEFEAPLQKHCSAPAMEQWIKGVKVFENCKRIPIYTPIAMFIPGLPAPVDGGFFVSCDDQGQVTILKQTCGKTGMTKDIIILPQFYYAVDWK